jgi:hypothetical protein
VRIEFEPADSSGVVNLGTAEAEEAATSTESTERAEREQAEPQ